jgi:hypothetical protein
MYGLNRVSSYSAISSARLRLDVLGLQDLLAAQDVDRALRAHHRDLRGRPGEVDVGAEVLGAHDVVGAAVGLAGDHRDQRDRRLGVGVEQLGAAADDAVPLLVGAGQEAGHVDEGETGMLNASQVRTKRAAFSEASMSRQPANCIGWLATMPDRWPLDAAEADDDVRREQRLHLEELAVVETCSMTVCMSYGWLAESGMSVSSSRSSSARGRPRPRRPGVLEVVLRQVGQQRLDVVEASSSSEAR